MTPADQTVLDLSPRPIREAPFQRTSRTSREAAARVRPKAPRQRERVYGALLEYGDATMHEIAAHLRIPLSSVCPRIDELREAKMVRDSGTTRLSPYGHPAVVWTARS